MKKDIFAICFVTAFLVAYAIIAYLEVSTSLVLIMFSLSPILVTWMVISVLKSTNQPQQKLKDDEEWGYQDINKEQLGIF